MYAIRSYYDLQITTDVHPDLRNKLTEAFGDIIPMHYVEEYNENN